MSTRFFLFSFLCTFILSASEESWESFKNETLVQTSEIPGWCTEEKARLIMDVILEHEFQTCVEVGVFSGKSLFPFARALAFKGSGTVHAIDAWDRETAIAGMVSTDPNHAWWSQLDLEQFYRSTLSLIEKNSLGEHCQIIKESSESAVSRFQDESVDFIHFDGNHTEDIAYQTVVAYFAKIKDGGYILLNDPNWFTMMRPLVFLLERTDIVSTFSREVTYILLRKNNQRARDAEALLSH